MLIFSILIGGTFGMVLSTRAGVTVSDPVFWLLLVLFVANGLVGYKS